MPRRVAKYGRFGPIYEIVPRRAYLIARNLWLDAKSLPRRLSGASGGPLPWMSLHNYGDGDFYASGQAFVENLQRQELLTASTRVLDIGCGSGRLAWPLAAVLSGDGAYCGFDVSKAALRFARGLVQRRRSDFKFTHADIFSAEYNPRGRLRAAEFKFPADANSVDLAIAISVFSHLLEADAKAFLREIARTLSPNGRAYITAYLVDESARKRIETGQAATALQPLAGAVWAGDLATPEAATGYDEDAFITMVGDAGLRLDGAVNRGGWSFPKTEGGHHQDVLILAKS
ncbi:MAG: class I SAM-dependent methyltransferase [Pseudomonadota bacterium]